MIRYRNQIFLVLFAAGLMLACRPQESRALDVGERAPDFTLTSITGEQVSLSALKGKIVVLEWFNYGCPFVRKHYEAAHMQKLQKEFGKKEVVWLTINSTSENHQDFKDAKATSKLMEQKSAASAHVLLDPEGTVGEKYAAKTTPHMYVIDPEGVLAYQGAIDDAPDTDSNPAEAENYLQSALNSVLAGSKPDPAETRPYGCSVKYAS